MKGVNRDIRFGRPERTHLRHSLGPPVQCIKERKYQSSITYVNLKSSGRGHDTIDKIPYPLANCAKYKYGKANGPTAIKRTVTNKKILKKPIRYGINLPLYLTVVSCP